MGARARLASVVGSAQLRGSEEVRIRRLLADSLHARLTLARGDTATAMAALAGLQPTGPPQALRWYPWESLGGEHLLLAELLLARGAAAEAMREARWLDAAAPIPYVMYLPTSLAIRERAARLLGFQHQAEDIARRIRRLVR